MANPENLNGHNRDIRLFGGPRVDRDFAGSVERSEWVYNPETNNYDFIGKTDPLENTISLTKKLGIQVNEQTELVKR